MYQCFARTNRGLEDLLVNELIKFGCISVIKVKSGAKFNADLATIMQINLHSRLASRVMFEVGQGRYQDEADIYDICYNIDWPEWFDVNNTIKVNTDTTGSTLKSLNFINLKVKDAICDKFNNNLAKRPNVDKHNPDIRIYNFLTHDIVTIYLDTSGESLFKRGYRENKLEAPLKENLAAGLIQLTNWNSDTTFYDPMCGSGTLAIEALSYALNLAPGLTRGFAFEKLKIFDKNAWLRLKLAAKENVDYHRQFKIYASDINKKAIEIAIKNIQELGFGYKIKFNIADFLTTTPPDSSGIILTNPPYGVRLNEQTGLAKFYSDLASHLKKNYANWDCYFLTSDLQMPKLMRLKPNRKIPLYNGALECRLFEFKIVSGSNR